MNFLNGIVEHQQIRIGDVSIRIPKYKWKILKENGYENKEAILGIRPEDICNASKRTNLSDETNIDIKVEVAELMGSEIVVYGVVNGQTIVSRIEARYKIDAGSSMKLNLESLSFFQSRNGRKNS